MNPPHPDPLPSGRGGTDPAPPFGSWRALYLLVVAELGALVLLFYALTRWAS